MRFSGVITGLLPLASIGMANANIRRQSVVPAPALSVLPPLSVASVPAAVSAPAPLSSVASAEVPTPVSAQLTGTLAPTAPATASSGPTCGEGYTYCGFMLVSGGHDFPSASVMSAYCDGLPGNCAGATGGANTTTTDAMEAVYYCLDGSSVQLLCACGGSCLNEDATNNIAHCDKPCSN